MIQHINSFKDVLDSGKELSVYDMFKVLEGADEVGKNDAGEITATRELNAYISDAKAVLMRDADAPDNPPTHRTGARRKRRPLLRECELNHPQGLGRLVQLRPDPSEQHHTYNLPAKAMMPMARKLA